MNHLYWEVVCKTAGCGAHQRVSHVDHYIPDEVLSLPWMNINVRCDSCKEDAHVQHQRHSSKLYAGSSD